MQKGFWNKQMIVQVWIFAIIIFIAELLLLNEKLILFPYIAAGFITIVLFFLFSNRLFHWWAHLDNYHFEKRLFIWSLGIRISAAIGLYFFYKLQTGEPFEYFAVDSKFYHIHALNIADHFRMGNFNIAEYLKELPFSDQGYNIYLGTIYTLTGKSIIASRVINALFSSLSVIFIYRSAKYISGEHVARIAGIAAMLLPNLLLYLGTGLKETIMVFIVSLLLLQTIRFVLLEKRSVPVVFSILLLLASLFLFRTVLAAVMCMAFISYGIFTNPSKHRVINIFSSAIVIAVFAFLLFSSHLGDEISEYLARTNTIADHMEFRATREGGNKLAVLAGAPLFLSVILIAPFPSFVHVPEQDILWMFIGGNFIRNVYAWFTILGIIYALKNNFRKHSILIFYVLGYLGVLANSGFALSERFHLPAVPGLIILSAIGLTHYSQSLKKLFPVYLFVASLLIIGWNYVKLAGRL
jgi:hypothetical protein